MIAAPMKTPTLVFALLLLGSAAAIGVALWYRELAAAFLVDSNFRTWQGLNDEQALGFLGSLNTVSATYLGLLLASNVLWIGGTSYLFVRLRKARA